MRAGGLTTLFAAGATGTLAIMRKVGHEASNSDQAQREPRRAGHLPVACASGGNACVRRVLDRAASGSRRLSEPA